MPVACSCIAGNYYLSYHPTNPTDPSDVKPNGPIITECNTLRHVVVSTEEAETGGLSIKGQNILPI